MSYVFNSAASKRYRKNLRNGSNAPERLLWSKLRGRQIGGYKFRRQFGIGVFIVDFYCPELKLAIEVDGDSHAGEKEEEYDIKRERRLAEFGIHFLRFTNHEVVRNLDGVAEFIRHYIAGGDNPSQPPLGEGRGS